MFFGGIYVIWGVEKFPLKKMVHLEEPLSRSIFVLRPFQKKNPREKTKISPRCARRQGDRRRKKQEEKFFVFRIVGPKAAEGCFSLKLPSKQGARSAREIFGLFLLKKCSKKLHIRTPRALQKSTLKRKKNTGPVPRLGRIHSTKILYTFQFQHNL